MIDRLGFTVPNQPSIDEINDLIIAVRTHTKAADEQAFDVLYEAMQKIGDICEKAVRSGRHKQAVKRIREICRLIR